MTKAEIHENVQKIFRDVFDEEDLVITDETVGEMLELIEKKIAG